MDDPIVAVGLIVGGTAIVVAFVLQGAAVTTAWATGHPTPGPGPSALRIVLDPARPWRAYGSRPFGPVWVFWSLAALYAALAAVVVAQAVRLWRRLDTWGRPQVRGGIEDAVGVADRRTVKESMSGRAMTGRAAQLRPSAAGSGARLGATDVAFQVGRARGVEVFVSVEDSVVVLGPPRSGKGLHLVIPAILDAPGAVVTTSTRPDNLAVTFNARQRVGPVAVFDPQRLAGGVPSAVRWSPLRGCEDMAIAMARARTLVTSTQDVKGGGYWGERARQVLQALLHAAALGGVSTSTLYRWTVSEALARAEALAILEQSPRAAAGAAESLGQTLDLHEETRGSIWSIVAGSLAPLGDPGVMAALSPSAGEAFDPQAFLAERSTLFLLGTGSGASSTERIVSALVEDVTMTAQRVAAASRGQRLDPPLSLVLDEAANYPLPSLPELMSAGGGSGIWTMAVLQSLAQARDRWGEAKTQEIWDSAIAKIVLGGQGNAKDLREMSDLIGVFEDVVFTEQHSSGSSWSTSATTREVAILTPGQIRQMRFGTGLLLPRAVAPVALELRRWTQRADGKVLADDRNAMETVLGDHARAGAR